MEKFRKLYPNVWGAECDTRHEKGDIIELSTKYGKGVECEVYNLIGEKDGKFIYSIVRLDTPYAQRKAEQHSNRAERLESKSNEWYEKSKESHDFLVLAEPIKVGHHSEKRHRALIERNNNRMARSFETLNAAEEAQRKAEYWEKKAQEITLATPDSLEFFKHKLEQAEAHHKALKDGTKERAHSYSLTYAKKEVNELTEKVKLAERLWG